MPSEEVTPGDIVLLSAGSLIPADGVLVEARDFFVNQAVLTGETFPVEKKPGVTAMDASLAERTNCVFMGANVRSGSATALIVQTGAATAFGQIAGRLTLRPPETEFERGIKRLGYLLSEVMLLLVLAIFAVNVALHKPVLDSLLFSVALAVGLTPQLLPAIINTSLSRGSQAMARSGVIVRRLASIENFGSMNVLCTDKTGALTEGVIKLDGALDVQGQPSAAVLRLAYLNAHFQTGLANPLDEAILAQAPPDLAGVAKIDEIPYDFVRKRLPMLPKQILLINFMTDLPEMTISADNVDPGVIDQPRRWDIDFIRRFMLVFGPLSSVFDFATFGALIFLLKADERMFHTGWFIESVFSAALVVFVLRTRLPIFRSRPGRGLVLATLATLAVTLLIPYSPLAAPLGFAPLPLPYLLLLGAIVLGYLASARLARDYFYRWEERRAHAR